MSEPRTSLYPLLILAFGNFVIGSGALAFIGMLDTVAADLDVSAAAAGQLAGIFSLGVCVSGPILGALTSRYPRREVLCASLGLFALGHVAAAFAGGYWSLLVIRVLTSFAGTLFTPQAAATVSLLVPAERRARTMAFVFLGWSIAAVAGLPTGAWVGAHFGWRTAMWMVAGLSVLSGVLVYAQVPAGLFVDRVDASAWRKLVLHPALLRVVAVTVVHATAQFTLFSYVVVAYRDALSATPNGITGLLCVQGIAGVAGNVLAGRIADRSGPAAVVLGAIVSMLAAFLVWNALFAAAPGPFAVGLALLAAVLWGSGTFSANSMQQVRLVDLAPPLAAVSVALNTSAIYLGQFLGAGLGGLALTRELTVPATRVLPWLGVPIFALAIWMSLAAERRVRAGGQVVDSAS
ncbi:MAG TPA: MFS transporter [Polyangiales bacterium]|nr:MFS transporter [Polyangiales bacterium]